MCLLNTDSSKNETAEHIDNFLKSGGSVKDIIGTLPSPELVEKVSQIKYIFRTLFKVLVRFVHLFLFLNPKFAIKICKQN